MGFIMRIYMDYTGCRGICWYKCTICTIEIHGCPLEIMSWWLSAIATLVYSRIFKKHWTQRICWGDRMIGCWWWNCLAYHHIFWPQSFLAVVIAWMKSMVFNFHPHTNVGTPTTELWTRSFRLRLAILESFVPKCPGCESKFRMVLMKYVQSHTTIRP